MIAGERTGNLSRAQPAEPQPRAPRPHRRRQRVGSGRHEHEHRAGRRLLQALEQRVLRVGAHRVRVVDDDHPAATLEGPIGRLRDDITNLFDLDGAALLRQDEQHVAEGPALNAPAHRALAAPIDREVAGPRPLAPGRRLLVTARRQLATGYR